MVMEFIDGQPLDDILQASTSLSFNRALKIFSQLLKGLHFAHESGVVHRDIKPSNIMVTNADTVKITDFGIARLPVSSEVTQMGFTVGTPHYMAPEQEASSNVDGRADLYSASVILMELLAKIPVTSAVEHFSLSPKGIYITPRVDMNQLIPVPFLSLIQRGLSARPDDRFTNAQEYATAVKAAVNELQLLTGDRPASIEANTQSNALIAERVQERKQKLRDMETMLVNYMGPIGASLIDLYEDQSASLRELAQKVAVEIASTEERKLFLRAWETDDEITQMPRVNTGRVQTSIKPVKVPDLNATVLQSATQQKPQRQSLQLDRKELRQIEDLLSQYVGPMAEYLLHEGIQVARDFSELVDKLTEAIPNSKEKTDFKLKVKQITR